MATGKCPVPTELESGGFLWPTIPSNQLAIINDQADVVHNSVCINLEETTILQSW